MTPPPSPLSTETIAVIRREAVKRAAVQCHMTSERWFDAHQMARIAVSHAIESCIREFSALTEGVLRARER